MNKTVTNEEVKQPLAMFNYVVVLLILAGLGFFYGLHTNVYLKWVLFLGSLIAAGAVFFFLAPIGINLHGYFRDSYREIQKVVWPTRKETVQMTGYVFLFVVVLGLFLWAVDTGLAWLLYGVILGKGS